jgi:hypothetical protein
VQPHGDEFVVGGIGRDRQPSESSQGPYGEGSARAWAVS